MQCVEERARANTPKRHNDTEKERARTRETGNTIKDACTCTCIETRMHTHVYACIYNGERWCKEREAER